MMRAAGNFLRGLERLFSAAAIHWFSHHIFNICKLDIWEMQLPEQLQSHPGRQNRCCLVAPLGCQQQTQRGCQGLFFQTEGRDTELKPPQSTNEALLHCESPPLRLTHENITAPHQLINDIFNCWKGLCNSLFIQCYSVQLLRFM